MNHKLAHTITCLMPVILTGLVLGCGIALPSSDTEISPTSSAYASPSSPNNVATTYYIAPDGDDDNPGTEALSQGKLYLENYNNEKYSIWETFHW